MQRRTLLKWISTGVSGVCAAGLAVPAVRFVLAPLARKTATGPRIQRVAALDQLPPGVPRQVPVYGARRDAWALYPREVIGRVWLIRAADGQTRPEDTKINAFTAECPHLGCVVDWNAQKGDFLCPCHRAAFTVDGKAIGSTTLGYDNPAPRDMDRLTCRVIRDEATDRWWVEIEFERFQMGTSDKKPV